MALATADGATLAYVADEDVDALHVMDITNGRARQSTSLGGAPAQIVVLADGRVAVALRDRNRVDVYEPGADPDQPLTRLCSLPTPVEPVGLALTPDEDALLVSSAWARRVTAYDLTSMKLRFTASVGREPRTVVVDEGGDRAFVAHVVGGRVSVVDLRGDHDVREIDLRVPKASTRGDDRRQSCQGFALAKSVAIQDDHEPAPLPPEARSLELKTTPPPRAPRGRIFAPRVTIDPGEPSRRSSGYGNSRFAKVESPIVSVIDVDAERNMTTALLEPTGPPTRTGDCLLPRAATISHATGGLLVACMGTDALVEMDPRGMDPARLERRRWTLPAGPTGVAVDDGQARAVVWSQFDRQLAVIDMEAKSAQSAVDLLSAPKGKASKLSALEAKGRTIFHQTDDMRISRDGRACASCHPDGREDALTWSTPVGPRQTIMLAGRLEGSAPFSWLGVHEDLEVHLNTTFQRLGGSGLHGAEGSGDLDALIAYLRRMRGPNLAGGLRDPDEVKLAERGERLFHADTTGCANCHVEGRTDAERYDLGTRAEGDHDDAFDTPSLAYVGSTAPYFHDGRYESLLELLMTTDSKMGHSMHLARRDALALAAFLETL